jgi:8-oxo-dGTP diphosphatase
MSRVANYCPKCGHALVYRRRHDRLRPRCPACDFVVYHDPKVAVVVVIIEDERVLLVKRANEPGKGLWACPAGFVDHDEAPEHAAMRETREETGLLVQIDRLLAVYPRKDHGLANIIICYQAHVLDGTLHAADDAEAVAWFGRDHLPPLVFYPSIMLIGIKWRNGQL